MMTMLVACTNAGESTPIVPTTSSASLPSAATDVPFDISLSTPLPSPTPKPPLEKDAWMSWPVVPDGVSESMRDLYQRGLEMGNDPTHFSVIGDCQNVSSYFLSAFEAPADDYSLGEQYSYLQPTIDYYQGSYSRVSVAVKGGFNAAAVISPLRSDPAVCNANESPLDCELRIWRPSIVFVSMETWWSQKPEQEYEKYMRIVLERIMESGAVPIIATKADNLEGDNAINATVAKLAYEYDIPMWNFWAAVQPLEHHGLTGDHFHLTFARNFFDDPVRMKSAWPWRNLTALQTLDAVHNALTK